MLIDRVADFRCPRTGAGLQLADSVLRGREVVSGKLLAPDGTVYPIEQGIPHLVDASQLTPDHRNTQAEYDRVADEIYDVAVEWQFAAMYEDEDAVRESMVDLLELRPGARVLEVGCGTGRDSFRLAQRLDRSGLLHMQDLSPGMLRACVRKMADRAARLGLSCALEYSVSNATALPFPADAFDAVFHFGGFNNFGDLRQAAAELMRVVTPSGHVLFGDEGVAPWLKGSEFDAVVTTNNLLFKADAPLEVLPAGAREVAVRWILGNCFYLIGFRKGDGPPNLNLDLPHKGWRGGTMRSRYYGQLEGVTVEAKARAKAAAARSGVSVHEWLDRAIKSAAEREP